MSDTKLPLTKAQRGTLTLIKHRALTINPFKHAVQCFHLGVSSERRHAASLIERANIGTPEQRKALANLVRLGTEVAPEMSKLN